jgi:ATP-binding cassette subfamily B protein
VIAHRPGTIALADTVVLLDDGHVVATGTHDELLATSERYRAVLSALAELDDVVADDALLDTVDDAAGGTADGTADDAADNTAAGVS